MASSNILYMNAIGTNGNIITIGCVVQLSSLAVSSSAVGVVDDMVSPPLWGNAIPSLLSLLANIAPRGASSAVGRTVRSDLSLLLYLTGYTGYFSGYRRRDI